MVLDPPVLRHSSDAARLRFYFARVCYLRCGIPVKRHVTSEIVIALSRYFDEFSATTPKLWELASS